MSVRTTTITVLIMILAAVLAGLLLWSRLPDQMASHWNANDQVDGTISRFWGVFLMPLVSLGMFLLFMLIPNIDPLQANIAKFRGAFNAFIAGIVGFMLYVHALTLLWNLGYTSFGIGKALVPALSVLLIWIGNLMRRAKRNWFIGIRTPWTLSSDTVWDKTHQLGASLFMISGALALLGIFFGGMTALWFLLAPLLSSTAFLLVYSYILYQRETKA